MATPTISRETFKAEFSKLEERFRFDLSKFDVSKLDVRNIDFPKVDVPKFDRSKLDAKLESFDLNERVDAFGKAVTTQLNKVEERLPAPADRVFHLQRTAAETGYTMTKNAAETAAGVVADATGTVIEQARTSTEKVTKTFRPEAKPADVTDVTDVTDDTVTDIAVTDSVATDVVEKVEDLSGEIDYTNWSRNDLYERAQELKIAGRSSMSKDELVAAITAR